MAQQKLILFIILSTLGLAFAQFSGIEYLSPVFRVSPYGSCSSTPSTTTLRSAAPCFTDLKYDFYNVTTSGIQIKSIAVVELADYTNYYVGLNTNQIWYFQKTLATNKFKFIQYAPAPTSNWAFAMTDTAKTYVAFVSQSAAGATLAKYDISINGTLITPPTTINLATSAVVNVKNVIYKDPIAYIAGSDTIVAVDLNALNVTSSVVVATTIPTVGNIVCGAAGNGNKNFMYGSDAGIVFLYDSVAGTVDATTAAASGESFSTACGARGNSYGVFFGSSSGRMYQFNFPATGSSLSPNPAFIVENVGLQKSAMVALTNSDQTGLYLLTYTSSGNVPDTVYEFYLYQSHVDFSSITQPTSPFEDSYYRNVFAAYILGSTIYIGTSPVNTPRVYQFTIPSTLATAANQNSSSTKSLLYADYSLPENPTGPNGRTNAIADVGQTAGNGDILLGNGVPGINLPANSSLSIPSRGPIVTYLRGTKSVPPATGGAANTDAPLALKLISLDEVSTAAVFVNGSSPYVLQRSMPFYSVDDAPWYIKQVIKPDGTSVTGYKWEIGVTDNLADFAHQFAYLVPPYPQVQNNTVSRPQSAVAKRAANQYTPGYVSFLVQQDVFLINSTEIQLNNITYNVTTRSFRYAITVNSWQYQSSSNYLRLNMIVGIGPDGNGTIAVFNGSEGNATTNNLPNPLLNTYVAVADSAEWTIVIPQNLVQGNGFVDVAAPTLFDPSTNMISVFLPYSNDVNNPGKSANQTYTMLMEYSYIAPPLPLPSIQDGGGPKLLPLWIVLGVLGGIVIIGIIVAIIVVIVLYRLVWRNKTEYEIRNTFDKTENALDRDRGAF